MFSGLLRRPEAGALIGLISVTGKGPVMGTVHLCHNR